MGKKEIIETMLKQDDKNGYAWYLLGMEYSQLGLYAKAYESFSKAITFSDSQLKDIIFEELAKIQEQEQKLETSANTVEVIQEEKTINTAEVIQEEKAIDTAEVVQVEKAIDTAPLIDETEETETGYIIDFNGHTKIPLRVIDGGIQKNKNKMEEVGLDTITFSDVGGLDHLKKIINMKIVTPFINPGLFDRFKKKVGGGVLLYGPPGCGKTFMARATAGECNARFLPVHITDILDPFMGVSERNVKDIFATARVKKPCILFFDELDTMGYSRSKLSSEHMRPVIDQLLTEIEGVDSSTDRLLILGATNMPWDIDSAFKRPGRFDKMVFVAPPDEAARVAIFKLKLKGKPVEEMNYSKLAAYTELYSGADIDNVIEVATENVINDILTSGIERMINMEDLLEAIANTRPSTLEWLRAVKNYVKYSNQAGLYDDVEKYLTQHKKLLGT